MAGMRLAKATEQDFETTRSFLQACENFWDNRHRYSLSDKETEWEDWDDEDEDKIELLRIRKRVANEEHQDEESVDNRLVLFEFMKQKYKKCDNHWGRLIMNADVLMENASDPTDDCLAFYPGFECFNVAPEQ